MRTRELFGILGALSSALAVSCAHPEPAPPPALEWQGWSDELFARAGREERLVILHLGAVWCHWCHVMEETTYKDPRVLALLARGYIPVHVDQDARPDLSSRYEDYGWPATIIFNSRGEELAKLQGYIKPERMAALLEAFIKDPSPGPSARPEKAFAYGEASALSPGLKAELEATYLEGYDAERGGWGRVHKYLDSDTAELALRRAAAGDKAAAAMADKTLRAALALIDPVWGGVFQYSDSGVWENPHFEKIMALQSSCIRRYAEAYARLGEPAYEKAARDVARFLRDFLKSPEGAFYTSQDADVVRGEHSAEYFALDDAGRRRRGLPKIDVHRYARENGWAIEALASLYAATGDELYLADARAAAAWVEGNRALPGGGFRHDAADPAGPYLADTLAMGRAYLALYRVTAEREWLAKAGAAADFIDASFTPKDTPGYTTARPAGAGTKKPMAPVLKLDENISLARFAGLLRRHSGDEKRRAMAERAMRYLASPDVAKSVPSASAGILLADDELGRAPAALVIVGRKDDPRARALFAAARPGALLHLRLEWWDEREGALPGAPALPEVEAPAAIFCGESGCAAPITSPDALSRELPRYGR
jgi:uncharacterized protein